MNKTDDHIQETDESQEKPTAKDTVSEIQKTGSMKENKDRPKEDQEMSQRTDQHKISAMSVKEYLEYKKVNCGYETEKPAGLALWNMLRSQINSGVQLKLPLIRIEIYARPELDYSQREILKYALYDGVVSDEFISKLADSMAAPDVMRARVSAERDLLSMSELVSAPIRSLDATIKLYQADIENFAAQAKQQKAEYEQRIAELTDEVAAKAVEISDRDETIAKLSSEIEQIRKERLAEKEKDYREKALEEKVQRLAEEKLAQMQIEKEAEDARIAMERRKWEAEYGVGDRQPKKRRLFKKKAHEEMPDEKKRKATREYKVNPLPSDFNLAAYIMSSGLSQAQMEIISLAVRSGVSDSQIKQMIDNDLPAQQMKQVLAVILTKQKSGK